MLDRLKRALSVPLAVLVLVYDALDALFGPLVRPIIVWAAGLRLFRRIAVRIAALPPYGALALLAVPFAAIEPFKLVALYWIAQGRVSLGGVAFVLSHLASLLISERIFHAGRDRLLEIGWFALGYRFVVKLRARAMAWLRSTEAWRAGAAFAVRARAAGGRLVKAFATGTPRRRLFRRASPARSRRPNGGA